MNQAMNRSLILFFTFLFSNLIIAQSPTPATERWEGFEKRKSLIDNSLVKNVPFKNIGPSIMSGRVTDIEVDPKNSAHFYVAYASGGLWETKNNGASFEPLFDHEIVMSIGDIAVDWNSGLLYVGTGENNSSRSSYSGVGLFMSGDDGKTWKHLGLDESHHIGRVIVHPYKSQTLWVACLGHLYSENKERGIYKTTDGGETWNQVYFTDENTGAIDLLVDQDDPDILYASMWNRTRRAWDFQEGGEYSEIVKSTDGGENWTSLKISDELYKNENLGRIGLTRFKQNGQEVLYALVDNHNRRPKEDEKEEFGLKKSQFDNMGRSDFLNLDLESLENFLRDNSFPSEYDAESVMNMVDTKEISPSALSDYLGNANSDLFETEVIGPELYRSDDGGSSWFKTHSDFLDDVCYTYGYYFGVVEVNPTNPEEVYIAGVPILRSEDGGKTFKSINGQNVHVDHHAIWIDPELPGHLINGNDGGINISYDSGENWIKCNSPAVGQFYTVQIDTYEDYMVHGGLQDNGVWYGPNDYEYSTRWHQDGEYPYKPIIGGDGMQIMIDERDGVTLYTGSQFGYYYRADLWEETLEPIQPKHKLGEKPYRFNWQTPIWLSKHNQDILYMGTHKLLRSMNKGDDWTEISEDLTWGGKEGDVPFGTITCVHESPFEFGLLYVGTDDGLIHVTKDGGKNWTNITNKLSKNLWVSRIKASQHAKSRVYVSMNGYRWDDFKPYLYISDDFGDTWTDIGQNLPNEPINVVIEDPNNEDLIFVGTDHGVYVSLDRGNSFMAMQGDLPAVAVHDMVIHPLVNDLVLGTHGRSIYKANITSIQMLNDEILNSEIYLYPTEIIEYNENWGSSWSKWIEAKNPNQEFTFFLKNEGLTKIEIIHEELVIYSEEMLLEKGINAFDYNLSIEQEKLEQLEKLMNDPAREGVNDDEDLDSEKLTFELSDSGQFFIKPGLYNIAISQNGKSQSLEFEVIENE